MVKSHERPAQDMDEQRSTNHTEEHICTVNDLTSYGSETWIWLKSMQNMINVFERWCYRTMLRILWTEHVTNEDSGVARGGGTRAMPPNVW